jgi:PrtD family type I secretion system ABC transporter
MPKSTDPVPGRVRRTARVVLFWSFIVSAGINLLMLTSPLYMLQIYDRVIVSQHVDTLIYLTIMAAVALAAYAALEYVRALVGQRLGVWLERQLAGQLISASFTAAQTAGGGRGVPALRDLASVRGLFANGGVWPLLDAPWTPVFYAAAFLIHPWLGWCGVAGGLLLVAIGLVNELASRAPVKEAGKQAIRSLGEADAALRNADAMLAMGILPNFLRRWERFNEAALAPLSVAGRRTAFLGALAKAIRIALQIATLGLGAYLAIRSELSGGAMIAASIIVARAVAPLEQAIGTWRSVIAAQTSWQRVKSLLGEGGAPAEPIRLPRPAGALTAEKVSYTMPGSREPVIRQVTFALAAGESLAVIGPSGAGKTTLLRLLAGSLTPQGGAVRLDAAAMSGWAAEDRLRYVGYLPQDVELFNATVRDNIARFSDAADEAVIEAASLAGAHETILRLPQGYDTMLGPGGITLSGGQRQRIGLARALFGDPRLVILDEPNSSLDHDGEQALQAAFRALKERQATVVLVTQRLGITAEIDKLLVLRNGQVEAFGPRNAATEDAAPIPLAATAEARGRILRGPPARPALAGGS